MPDIIRKIASIPPDRLARKVLRYCLSQARKIIGEMNARIGGLEVKPSQLSEYVGGMHLSVSDAAESVLQGIRGIFGIDDEVITLINETYPAYRETIVNDATAVSSGKFRILGYDFDYSGGIRWYYDPSCDHEFNPGDYYSKVVHSKPDGGYDIKYPWELSRLQHIPRLAIAFRLSGDTIFKKALAEQVSDWIRSNPVGFGPNWACTMDVAIRAANIVTAISFLGPEKLNSDFKTELVCNLIAHGKFISGNLEWSDELTSNHYLSDIAGLCFLGTFLAPSVPIARTWREFAVTELESEILKQVNEDGWDFEASTAYHRLVLECFLYPALILRASGINFSDEYNAKLSKMAGFVRDISTADGSFPLIGDNDSGQFLSLYPGELENLRYLEHLTALFLGDRKVEEQGDSVSAEYLLMKAAGNSDTIPDVSGEDRNGLSEYPDGGLYIIRNKSFDDIITFRLGSLGQNGNGGHAHNDQLSITAWFGGVQVIADPGTAVYTSDPEKRNRYRSTRSHATISFGDIEQNRFTDGNLFTLKQEAKPVYHGSTVEGENIEISGSLEGYGPWSAEDLKVKRTIKHTASSRTLEISDRILQSDNLNDIKPEWNFPLAPGLVPSHAGTVGIRISGEDDQQVAEIMCGPGWGIRFEKTGYSPGYGIELEAYTVRMKPLGDLTEGKFIIRPL